jgi:hypothetical protein
VSSVLEGGNVKSAACSSTSTMPLRSGGRDDARWRFGRGAVESSGDEKRPDERHGRKNEHHHGDIFAQRWENVVS